MHAYSYQGHYQQPSWPTYTQPYQLTPSNHHVPFPMTRSTSVGHNQYVQPPMPRPRHITDRSRSKTPKTPKPSPSPSAAPPPLKSALKKTVPSTVIPSQQYAVPFTRTRTQSDHARARANSLTRPRSREASWKHYTPSQLFVTLVGHDKIKFDSIIFQSTVDEIRERVLPIWPPGIDYQRYSNETNDFIVKFNGQPWAEKGKINTVAMKLILSLFATLAGQYTHSEINYICQAVISPADPSDPPRLVFRLEEKVMPAMSFFMISFSDKRRKMRLVCPPPDTAPELADHINRAFPRNLAQAAWQADDTYKIELKQSAFDRSISDLVVAEVMEFVGSCGYQLMAAIPIPQSGLFSRTSRREIWIFQGFDRSMTMSKV